MRPPSSLPPSLLHAKRSYRTGLIAAVITALCWAVLALFLKYALFFTDSETLSWFRLFFSAMALLIYFSLRRVNPLPKFLVKKKQLVGTGALLALNYLGYNKGIEFTNPSHAQIMIQGSSLTLFLIGAFYFKETIRRLQWAGFCLTIFGFCLFYLDQAPASGPDFAAGNLWLIVGGLSWGLFAAFQRNLLERATATEVNLLVFGISSLFLLPLVDFPKLISLSTFEWLWLGLCGAVTLVAYNALAMALARIPSSIVAPIITLNPLVTIAIMFILLELPFRAFTPDTVQLTGLIGALSVVLGVILVVARPKNNRA